MYHIGVDLHKDSMTIATTSNEDGKMKITEIPCKCVGKVKEFFGQFSGKECRVLVEAVGFYHWFWDAVSPLVSEMVLVNAVEARKYSANEPKTDARDARKLAELSLNGEVNRNASLRVFVPDHNLRALREATRHRHQIARSLSHAKNRFRRYLLKNNLAGPRVLDNSSIQKWLAGWEGRLSPFHRFALRQLEDQILILSRQVRDSEAIIGKMMEEPRYSKMAERISSVPGVGKTATPTIIAEVGDFKRFADPQRLASFAGLVPRVFQSGNSCRHGRITKKGSSNLRWILQQAAWVAIREDSDVQRIFAKISRRAGRKKAATAIARKILCWLWAMERNKENFREERKETTWYGNERPAVTLTGFMGCNPLGTSPIA